MPGPGGGSRGGGARGGARGGGFSGSRGGSFGGSRGGSFGGPRGGFGPRPPMHHHHHMPHMHYGGFWPRRTYHHGGGGCMGAILAPFIVIAFVMIMIFSAVTGSVGVTVNEMDSNYDEETFQTYADSQYRKAFGDSSAYEDNILIVLLTNENADDYYYIAWVGDHVARDINYMFGNNETELGNALYSSINMAGYWYSLDSNLAGAVDMMTKNVESLGLESSFTCNEAHSASSKLINYTSLSLTEETVNTSLEAFTDATGIPICIVVEDFNDVFPKTASAASSKVSILPIILIVLVAIVVVYLIVKSNKEKGERRNDSLSEDEYKGPEID